MRATTPTLKLVAPAIDPTDIVAMARRARESAAAFRAVVDRFGTEMPDSMDRFHHAMKAFRTTAAALRSGAPTRVEPTPLETVTLRHAA